jgi:hypothetical protein
MLFDPNEASNAPIANKTLRKPSKVQLVERTPKIQLLQSMLCNSDYSKVLDYTIVHMILYMIHTSSVDAGLSDHFLLDIWKVTPFEMT